MSSLTTKKYPTELAFYDNLSQSLGYATVFLNGQRVHVAMANAQEGWVLWDYYGGKVTFGIVQIQKWAVQYRTDFSKHPSCIFR